MLLREKKILIPILILGILALGLVYVVTEAQKQNQPTTTSTTNVSNISTSKYTCNCDCKCKCDNNSKTLVKSEEEEERGENKVKEMLIAKNIDEIFEHAKGLVKKIYLNLTSYTGQVISKSNKTLGIIVSVNNVNYSVYLLPVYVRVSDGALVSGLWLFNSISPGSTIEFVSLQNLRNTTRLPALSLEVGGVEYVTPLLYYYQTFHT